MSRLFVMAVVLALAPPGHAVTQSRSLPLPGQRARIAYRCALLQNRVTECRENRPHRMDTGQVHSVDSDTLRLQLARDDIQLAIPTESIVQVWVADGRKRNLWKGVKFGVLGGALLGGIVGATREICIETCGSAAPLGLLLGVPLGALVGGIIGSQSESDRWRALPGHSVKVGAAARAGGIVLAVSIAF